MEIICSVGYPGRSRWKNGTNNRKITAWNGAMQVEFTEFVIIQSFPAGIRQVSAGKIPAFAIAGCKKRAAGSKMTLPSGTEV